MPAWTRGGGISSDIAETFALLWRRLDVLAASTAAGLAIGLAFVAIKSPAYMATGQLLIDSRETKVTPSQSVIPGGVPDNELVESQVEVLKSARLLLKAIERVGPHVLRHRPPPPAGAPRPSQQALLSVLDSIEPRYDVKRKTHTFVVEINFKDRDPDVASRFVNAVLEVYVEDQKEQKHSFVRQANDWIGSRIKELRPQVIEAERQVQAFRAKNNLLGTSQAAATDPELLESTRQLGIARSQLAEAQARLRQAQALAHTPDRLTSVSDALQSKVIADYRGQYAQIKRKHSQLVARFGANHPQTVDAQAELDSINREIELELQRIVEGARNSQEVAERHVRLLEESIEQMRRRMEERERMMLDLNELDREAKATGAFYVSLLTRLKETQAQETFQHSDARIISHAIAPQRRADARPSFVLPLTTLLGLALGLSGVLIGNATARGVTSRRTLERELGLAPLGALPLLGHAWPAHRSEPAPEGPDALQRYVLDHPSSTFSRAVRSALRATTATGK